MSYRFTFLLAASLLLANLAHADEPQADEPQTEEPQTVTVYRIGNSLTWDSQPVAIQQLAALAGEKHVEGYHINCGKPLERIWTHPDEVCVKPAEPFGTFTPALTKYEWTAVAMQPHPGAGTTLKSDATRILDFIKLTQKEGRNPNAIFYIYAAWPGQNMGKYSEAWTADIPDKDDQPTTHARAYYEHLYKRVCDQTDADVRIIPAGEVIYELEQQMLAGKLKDFTDAHQLYRDRVHLTQLGRYSAGVTVYATIHGKDPKGLTKPDGAYGNEAFPDHMVEAINNTAWKVINKLDGTGVKADVEAERE